jgi:hypothetical protein
MKNLLLKLTWVLSLFLMTSIVQAQIAINTSGDDPDAGAMLDISSSDKGILIPRTTMASITSPSAGLLIYDTDLKSLMTYDGMNWVALRMVMSDTDNDTKIQVEESADEDMIRMDVGGVEVMTLGKTSNGFPRLNLPNGNENIIIGNFAGNSITTGYNNILIGRDAGKFGAAFNRNVFIGYDAGESNLTGIGNVFIGQEAGDKANSNYNTFVGAWSGLLTTTGGDNTFIGQDAGILNTTGSSNTFIGKQAGYSNSTGSSNVFIGREAGYSETGSNKLYIDNSNTASPLIYGEFDNDRIGINRVATTNTLEVGGEASKASAGDWLANSDARLKKNITTLNSEAVLQQMLSLQGITYEWNDTTTNNERPTGIQYGFTAQNIQEVFPTLVTTDNQGYLQTAYGTYDAMYVEAIRALNDKIENLTNANKNLKAQNQALQSDIEALKAAVFGQKTQSERQVTEK